MSKQREPHQEPPKSDPTAPSPGAPGDDFAAMLAAYDVKDAIRLQPGARVRGKVFHITRENAFVSLSASQEGVLPKTELNDENGRQEVALGDTIDVFVVSTSEGIQLTRKLGRDQGGVEMLEQARDTGIPVEGTVTAVNKGGVEVSIGPSRAFCPMGQLDINFIEDPQTFIGQTLQFVVKEVKERGRNVVLSRRALLQAQRAEKVAQLKATLAVGKTCRGKVTRVAAFGAFVDLGGLDGLIPISELTHGRVARVEDVLNVGDTVEVEVRSIEDDAKGNPRISLSRKALLGDPWADHAGDLADGSNLEGKVVRLEPFGAFVELFDGIQGLVHVSELSAQRVRHPSDILQVGQAVTVRVLGVDRDAKRVSLSLREAASRDKAGSDATLAAGSNTVGVVERIENYGVFVALESGGTALLPAAETGTPRGTDLRRVFPIGTRIDVQVIGADDRGRLRVSKTARERSDEQSTVADFNRSQGGSSRSLGTLGDLLKARTR